MVPSANEPISKADLTESAIIESIKRGDLGTWIFNNAQDRIDSVEFMTAVAGFLTTMQQKGIITGFRAAYLSAGNALPIVTEVQLAA